MFGYTLLALLAAALLMLAPLAPGQSALAENGIFAHPDAPPSSRGPAPKSEPATKSDWAAKTEPTLRCEAARSLAGREVPVDTQGGPRLGTVQFPDTLPLKAKEVVLTFDDGPHSTRTRAILDALDRYCVKAVFFVVGARAMAHPDVLRDVARRGHVIGTHSFSHPLNMARLAKTEAVWDIDAGFAAVAQVLGGPVAPLFRFPGFAHSRELLSEMSERNISVWSVDVVTDDSFIGGQRMTERLFERLGQEGRGMVLLHDIKRSTAQMLPGILERLKAEGYSIPRVTVAPTITPDERQMATLEAPRPTRSAPQQGLLHRASEKSGSAPVSSPPSAPFEFFHPDAPVPPAR
jgi:peptidoglycan/xylan/chitin deacetylase (PgdA/CDA1 family)